VANPGPAGQGGGQSGQQAAASAKRRQRELDRIHRENVRSMKAFEQAITATALKLGALAVSGRAVSQAVPSGVSTFQKSMDLVLAQLGTVFVPVLAHAIAFLQDFAVALKDSTQGIGKWAAGLGASLEYFTTGKGPGESPYEFQRRKLGDTPERRKRFEEFQKVDGRYQSAYEDAKGGKLGDTVEKYFKGLKPGVGADPRKFPKEVAEALEKQGRLKDFEDFYGKLAGFGKGDGKTNFDPVKGKGGKGGAKPYLTDFPPGYQARESGVADLRSQLQMQAFSKSPLDAEKERLNQKNHELLVEWLRKIAENTGRGQGTGAPPRTA
jgi:hypothetical protein